jgi:hypothetical protein
VRKKPRKQNNINPEQYRPVHIYQVDRQAGSLPDIRREIGGIVFVLAPPGIPSDSQLVIRMDDDGGQGFDSTRGQRVLRR